MRETKVNLQIELDTDQLSVGDSIMKKLIFAITPAEINLIKNAKVTLTVAEVEMGAELFNQEAFDANNGC